MTRSHQWTIINVNDSSTTQASSVQHLREAGYRVIEASTNEEACSMAEREGAALLLLREQESEAFHVLADHAPALLWMNGPDGCEFVNQAYLDFLGVHDVDVRGFDWAQYVHPDDCKGYVAAYLEALAERRLFEATFRFRRHDGEYRWMKSVGTPRFGPDGGFLGYVGSTIDVTELQTRAFNYPSPTSTGSDRNGELHRRFRTASTWLASMTACIAGLVLVGWGFGLTLLTSISSSFMSMKITTAVGFLCSAGSVLLFNTRRSKSNSGAEKALGLASITLAVPAVLLGFGTLLGYSVGLAGDATHPGWMAQATAGCFVLLWVALMFANRCGRISERISEFSTFLVLCIAGVALIGCLYDKSSLYAVGPYSSMALHTALSFVFLGAALLCAGPDRGLMATLSSGEPGAVMMRRMLPLTVGLLVITGWIRLVGEHKGWFGSHFGLTLLVGLNVVGFGMILWSVARSLNSTESALRESEERLQAILDRAPAAFFIKDAEGRSLFMNEYCAKVLGVEARAANGKTEYELFPRDLADQFRANDAKVWKSGKLSVVEEYIPSMEGIRTYLSQKFLLQDPQGAPYALCGIATDITERKQVEKQLRENEERLRLAQQAARVGTFEWNLQTNVNTWTPELEALYGLQRGEFGRTQPAWEQLIHPDDRSHALQLVEQAFETGQPIQGEWRTVWPDGTVHWLAGRWQVFKDSEGTPLRMTGVNFDITERKQAEERLRENEERLRLAQGIAQAGIFDWNVRTNEVTWTAELESVYGLRAGEFSRTYQGFRDRVHPDDVARIEEERDRALSEHRPWHNLEFRIVLPSGDIRWVDSAGGGIYDASGTLHRVLGINMDITERKRAEERLRASEERLQLAMKVGRMGSWDWDVLTGRVEWSPGHFELLGLRPGDVQPSYEAWASHVHRHDLPGVEKVLQLAMASRDEYRADFRVVWADGSTHWMAGRGRFDYDADGRCLRMVGVMVDITERKQTEEALWEAQARLQRWNVELAQVVEVKTVELVQSQDRLRAMAAELNLLEQRERKRLATELHDHLQQMLVVGKLAIGQSKRAVQGVPVCETALKKVDDVLSDALAYSRTLVAELSPPVLRDHGLAASLKWLAEYMKNKHDHRVTVVVPDDEDLRLPEDQKILLFQSARELLINSSKHAGTGEATIRMEQRDGQLRIDVHDEGVGFDLAAAAAAAAGTTDGGISSKFGLFSIQERMRALGGLFTIQSALGAGTTATLTLPQQHEAKVKAEMKGSETILASALTSTSTLRSHASRIRVLLVDDHAMVREGLRSVLDAYEDLHVVGEGRDGVEAVKLVEELRPRVVVMDVNMPKMTGIEAATQIKIKWPETTIIGISVNIGDDNATAMKRAGAVIVLAKDSAVDELHQTIQQVLKT